MNISSKKIILILILGLLNTLTPFSIDMYLPAFPQIAADLGVDVGRMSLTVSSYFIGFALGQIFYGPLLDRFGRKPPIYVGLGLYILASLGCLSAHSFQVFLLCRFLSALGGSAASVGATSMVRDYFPAKEGGKIFSMLMLVLSVSPLLAPSVGSMMVGSWGWRSLFVALIIIALFDLLLVARGLPLSYKADPTVDLRLKPILITFKEILSRPQFRTYTFAGSFSFAGLFVFVSSSPAVFMEGMKVSAQTFGIIFAVLAGGMILGGQLNHLLLKYADGKKVFKRALLAQVMIGSVFLLGTLLTQLNLSSLMVIIFFFLLCSGITYPNAAALALEPFSKNIGSASSLLGFLQLGVGSLAAACVGLLNTKGTLPMAVVMAGCSFCGLMILLNFSESE